MFLLCGIVNIVVLWYLGGGVVMELWSWGVGEPVMCGAWVCGVSAVSGCGVEWGDRESVLWSVRRGDGGGGWGVCGMWCVCGVDGWVSGWMDGCIARMEDGVGW